MSGAIGYLIWVACGVPFLMIATAHYWKTDRSLGIAMGLFFALALGPLSLGLIKCERDVDESEHQIRDEERSSSA